MNNNSLPLYQVDAFTDKLFGGNPAAIVPLEYWLDDALLQQIAMENNLSETAFFVQEPEGIRLRWFTPTAEVKLCGHATLASAFVWLEVLHPEQESVTFETLSGPLQVAKHNDGLQMSLPAGKPETQTVTDQITYAVGSMEQFVTAEDGIAILSDQAAVQGYVPNLPAIAALPYRGLAVTAPGEDCDFVCRFFAPGKGINEDPVTGSLFAQLVPYWSERLGKTKLVGRQLSQRGGRIECEWVGNKVLLQGGARLFLEGMMHLPQ